MTTTTAGPRRLALLVLVSAGLLLFLPPASGAGTYVVDGCADPTGVGTWGHVVRPTDGWYRAQGVYPSRDDCGAGASGRGLYVTMAGGPSFFRFDAPASTSIDRLSVVYRAHLSAGAAWAVPTLAVEAAHDGSWETIAPARGWTGGVPLDFGGFSSADARGATALRFGVRCELQGPCVEGGEPEASFRALAVRISDDHPPEVALRAPEGHVSGIVELELRASDAGGGLHRLSLRAGERGVRDETLCEAVPGPSGERHVTRRVPCPGRADRTASVDTRVLPDGEHRVVARAEDIAGAVRDVQASLLIDNLPPVAGIVTLTGLPRVGEALTADTAGFSGQGVGFEYRWQRCAEQGCIDIGGAVERTYAPRAGDEGHRLRVRVLARDGGGTTTVVSALTDVVGGSAVQDAPAATYTAANAGEAGVSADGVRLYAWLERGRRRVTSTTTAHGVRVRIRGRLTDSSGRPLGRAPVAMQEQRDGGAWRPITGVRTRRDGRFTTFTKVGPSRRFRLMRDGAAVYLRQRVRAPVVLWRVRGGHVAGRVTGGWVPAGGVRVAVQTRRSGSWVTRATVRSDGAGHFGARARLSATARVRALAPAQSGYPFARGTSRPAPALAR